MGDEPPRLPLPPWTHEVVVPPDADTPIDGLALPAARGVFLLEDEHDRPISLVTSANVRQLVRARLEPRKDEDGPTRRADLRAITRRVRALTVGSRFEADWAYLQHARRLFPATYGALFDRWSGWFVMCRPTVAFPRWVKQRLPATELPDDAVLLGPIRDKHAAQRYIEMLEDAFDLCRYHHILQQSPHGTACVYKEMGKCPAPCDGSIGMDAYRTMIADSIAFGSTRYEAWAAMREAEREAASAALDFERAKRVQQRLDATGLAGRPGFRLVTKLGRFRYVIITKSDRPEAVRVFIAAGGWIAPIVDAPRDIDRAARREVISDALTRVAKREFDPDSDALENMALLSAHVLRVRGDDSRGTFVHVDDPDAAAALKRAWRRVETPDDVDTDQATHELFGNADGQDL